MKILFIIRPPNNIICFNKSVYINEPQGSQRLGGESLYGFGMRICKIKEYKNIRETKKKWSKIKQYLLLKIKQYSYLFHPRWRQQPKISCDAYESIKSYVFSIILHFLPFLSLILNVSGARQFGFPFTIYYISLFGTFRKPWMFP